MTSAAALQVLATNEVKVFPDKTPSEFAESIFCMMERFPAAPLSKMLTQQQMEQLRDAYMAVAVSEAEALPAQNGGIVCNYVMLWAIAQA